MKILQITTRGLKNIDKNLTVNFCNTTIEKNNKIKGFKNVSGFYGGNGAGKSAFICSIYLYSMLTRTKGYLFESKYQSVLKNLINYKIKEFFIEVIFLSDAKKVTAKDIFKHSILLKYDPINDRYEISSEYYGVLKGRTLNDDYVKIVEINNDTKSEVNSAFSTYKNYEINERICKYILNDYRGGSSFITSYLNAVFSVSYSLNRKNLLLSDKDPLFALLVFSLSLNVYMLDDDKIENLYENNQKIERIKRVFESNQKNIEEIVNDLGKIIGEEKYVDIVPDIMFKNYKENVEKLKNFIKIFKPELCDIVVDSTEVKDKKRCRKIFCYKDDIKVDIKYESSGIKHLSLLHSFLQNYINGLIVFVDEMDVNINTVYLSKLVEFLVENGKGQLCFTSHNLSPMEKLNNKHASINVIGFERKIDVWKKLGNRNPSNYYYDGCFENSPFNVETFDFLKAF